MALYKDFLDCKEVKKKRHRIGVMAFTSALICIPNDSIINVVNFLGCSQCTTKCKLPSIQ